MVGLNGSSVATIEHLMATLRALDVDNATIEIDGPEVPVMDGSAGAFLEAVDEAGIAALDAPRSYIKVLRPVAVRIGELPVPSSCPMTARASRSRSISPIR